jgi:hypothetical protein
LSAFGDRAASAMVSPSFMRAGLACRCDKRIGT